MILRYIAEQGCEPSYATDGAAGIDLRAAEAGRSYPDKWLIVRTGLRIEIPCGHVGLVRGRSGMAFGAFALTFEGTIDQDYRGELKVLLITFTGGPISVRQYDRIAQLLIVPVVRCELEPVRELSETARGTNGFGSTGVK